MSDEIIQKLEDLKETVNSMQNVKGRQAVIAKIRSSIQFLQMHKVDKKTAGLIIKNRENDISRLENSKEYKQVEINWRSPKHLRDKPVEIVDDEIPDAF